MRCRIALLTAGMLALSASGAEWVLDLRDAKPGDPPTGFRSAVSGAGQAGDWRVVEEDAAPSPESSGARSSVATRRRAVAQLARDTGDEHYPLLIFDQEVFGDFSLNTRFKTVSGGVEQMAGIAFRIQDEKNYYVVRASSLGNTFRFYKFVDGQRTTPIGPEIEVPRGKWHEMAIDCHGNQIRARLNGRELISVTDNSFTEGKIAFWTKSDSVSHFAETHIIYTPKVRLADKLVTKTLEQYPRLLGLKIYGVVGDSREIRLIASSDAKEVGQKAGDVERDVLENGHVYYGKTDDQVVVTLPLHDRNGEPAAAVQVRMKSFPGQTERNAVARAQPILKKMEASVRSARDLTQ
jgi:hypothetical protein